VPTDCQKWMRKKRSGMKGSVIKVISLSVGVVEDKHMLRCEVYFPYSALSLRVCELLRVVSVCVCVVVFLSV